MNKIKEIRIKKGITQIELSKKLKIDKSTISKWETTQSLPRPDKLVKLAEILNCTVDELLK